MSTILPVSIKPYLIHVLFKFFEGKEYNFNDKKVKSVKVDLSSSIGRWLRSHCIKANRPIKPKFYNLVLELPNCSSAKWKGTAHQYVNGRNHFLYLPEEFVDDFNHFLEDIYRTRICAFLDGYGSHDKATIKQGIRDFMKKYDLEEYDQTLESIERLYMREKENTTIFDRFQHKWTHNIAN